MRDEQNASFDGLTGFTVVLDRLKFDYNYDVGTVLNIICNVYLILVMCINQNNTQRIDHY